MHRILLKSKVHRATVTAADLGYEGSISIDKALLEAADIRVHEQVTVANVNTGARFETYAIQGGKGVVQVNGAAARLVQPGDLVIVLTYATYSEDEAKRHLPRIVHVDAKNLAITKKRVVSGHSG